MIIVLVKPTAYEDLRQVQLVLGLRGKNIFLNELGLVVAMVLRVICSLRTPSILNFKLICHLVDLSERWSYSVLVLRFLSLELGA